MRHGSRANPNGVSPHASLSVPQSEHYFDDRPVRQSPSIDEIALFDPSRDADLDSARREAGSRLLRDALRHRQPGRRLRIPRESSLRFEAPRLPHSPDEMLRISRESIGDYARIRQTSDSSPFSPRFAPAYAFRPENSSTSARSSPPSMPLPQVHITGLAPPPPPPPLNVRYLRRVGHRSISETNGNAASSQPAIDGLGDRQRSASPDDDLDNAWETLLTTLAPDPTLPSAESSFTSTAASANTNPSRAADSTQRSHSSQTHRMSSGPSATVQMILHPYPEFINPCDLPGYATDSDTEAESDLELRRTGSRQYRPPRARLHDSPSVIGSTQDSQPPPFFHSRSRSSRTSALPSISSFVSQGPSSAVDMRAIVDRLAQRQDIPDGWWATAGLSRAIGRQLDVGDGTPDSAGSNRTSAGDEA